MFETLLAILVMLNYGVTGAAMDNAVSKADEYFQSSWAEEAEDAGMSDWTLDIAWEKLSYNESIGKLCVPARASCTWDGYYHFAYGVYAFDESGADMIGLSEVITEVEE